MQTFLSAAPLNAPVSMQPVLHQGNLPAMQPALVDAPGTIVQEVVRTWAVAREATISLMPGPQCRVAITPDHFRALLRGVLEAVFEGPTEWLDIEMTCRKGLYLIEICGPSAARQQKSTTFFGRRMKFLDDRAASGSRQQPTTTFSQRTQQFAQTVEAGR